MSSRAAGGGRHGTACASNRPMAMAAAGLTQLLLQMPLGFSTLVAVFLSACFAGGFPF